LVRRVADVSSANEPAPRLSEKGKADGGTDHDQHSTQPSPWSALEVKTQTANSAQAAATLVKSFMELNPGNHLRGVKSRKKVNDFPPRRTAHIRDQCRQAGGGIERELNG
jgi:hypothetical protein